MLELSPAQAEHRRLIKMRARATTLDERLGFEIELEEEYSRDYGRMPSHQIRVQKLIKACTERLSQIAESVRLESEIMRLNRLVLDMKKKNEEEEHALRLIAHKAVNKAGELEKENQMLRDSINAWHAQRLEELSQERK